MRVTWKIRVAATVVLALPGLILTSPSVASEVRTVVVAEADETQVPAAGASTWVPDGYYRIGYSGEIWYVDSGEDVAYALTYDEWASDGFPAWTPAPTDYVRYAWSTSISAVTFFGPDRDQWLWDHVTLEEWNRAGRPAPRTAGWIEGSYWYQWGTSPQVLVEDAGGVNHVLSYAEWTSAGSPEFERRCNEGFVILAWMGTSQVFRLTVDSVGGQWPRLVRGHHVASYAEWQAEGFPEPFVTQRVPGDRLFTLNGGPEIRYSLPQSGASFGQKLTLAQWQMMGSPRPVYPGESFPDAPLADC